MKIKRNFPSLSQLLLLGSVMLACSKPFGQEEFSSSEWKKRWQNERAPMVTSLLEDVLYVGMPREEIEALLGPPDFLDYSGFIQLPAKNPVESIQYELGFWTGRGGGDATFVDISITPEGNMTDAKLAWM